MTPTAVGFYTTVAQVIPVLFLTTALELRTFGDPSERGRHAFFTTCGPQGIQGVIRGRAPFKAHPLAISTRGLRQQGRCPLPPRPCACRAS